MKITSKKISDTKVELKVALDAADLEPLRAQAVAKLAKDVRIQGFRKGKAPLAVVEKNLSPNDISTTALDLAIQSTVPKAFIEKKLNPVVLPRVSVEKYVPNETLEYTAAAEILPEIKLGDYKKLKTKRLSVEVKDKDIQEVIDGIRKAYAEKKAVERAAKKSDEVIIDFVGKRNGEEFKGGSAKDYALELGSNTFIPGFEDQIIGHKAGDKFNIEVTFPENYGEKTLAGQPAVFETEVKQVNEIQLPETDDKFVAKCGPFKTLQELKDDIKKNLEAQNNYKLEDQFRDALIGELVQISKVSAPEALIEDQAKLIRNDTIRNAESRGLSLEDYLQYMGQTEKEWSEHVSKLAKDRVEASLVLQTLVNQENITVTDEEVEAKVDELRNLYRNSKEAIKNLKRDAVKNDIRHRLAIDKAVDLLISTVEGKKSK